MKLGKDSRGFSVVEILLVVVALGLIVFTGWYVWNARQTADDTLSVTNSSSSNTATTASKSTAPTMAFSKATDDCTTAVSSKGDALPVFTGKEASYTYANTKLGLEFSYPKSWGAVHTAEDSSNSEPICVGPLQLKAGKAGVYAQGDDILILPSTGYFKKNDATYYNWFKDSSDGPVKVALPFVTVKTKNAEALELVNIDCAGDYCPAVAMVNLKRNGYAGFGVADWRVTTEQIAASGSQGGLEKDKSATSPYSNDEIQTELKKFLVTISVAE